MSDKLKKELANAIQTSFKGFEFKNTDSFATDLADYVDASEVFKCLSKETLEEILSEVKTQKTDEGAHNII